jgi:hypothetical protein
VYWNSDIENLHKTLTLIGSPHLNLFLTLSLVDFSLKLKQANDLLSSQQSQLNELLIKNKELFVTKENPKLGLTNLVEHQIHLKPDAVSKHQRPYKLPPHKRDVLRHQLDKLLSQGIIAPVNEKEHIPISSPIVLVSRRNRPNSGLETLRN